MEYILDSVRMKAVDTYSINMGIPSLVLMERAALEVSRYIEAKALTMALTGMQKPAVYDTASKIPVKVLVVCGSGNNGADGLAVARHLMIKGCQVTVWCGFDETSSKTEEYTVQLGILKNMGADIRNSVHTDEYDYIVDALFGIGLTRNVTGVYAECIGAINDAKNNHPDITVVSVDIPSGIDASSGKVCGCAVKADATVTFGYKKIGHILYPGAMYAGDVIVGDAGFIPSDDISRNGGHTAFTYDASDIAFVPHRGDYVNKGDCGKILIVAGSSNMGGAAFLSAGAAYRTGAGLVKVYTHANNRDMLLRWVPEAVPVTYGNGWTAGDEETLINACHWADCVVAGPGLSQDKVAEHILETVIRECSDKPLVLDADAINMIARDRTLLGDTTDRCIILTPHMGEMSRLTGEPVADIKANPIEQAITCATAMHLICVLKDARTVVTDGTEVYINTTGNGGMATAGSGDVLTGILAGMLTSGFDDIFKAVAMGINIHGATGDVCAGHLGTRSMKAWDMVEMLPEALRFVK